MIVAGTGHRPDKLGGYGEDAFIKLNDIAYEWLQKNKPEKVISGMAIGWDQALAQAAADLNIPLVAAIPFDGQEKKWPTKTQNYYHELLKRATEIRVICQGGYSNAKFLERDRWMVDNSTLVLAMYNGDSTGGTAYTVNYAKTLNRTIVNLYPIWSGNKSL